MKLKFKHQDYQTLAVNAVIDCFAQQQEGGSIRHVLDSGTQKNELQGFDEFVAYKNSELTILKAQILKNIRSVQKRQNLTPSSNLVQTSLSPLNLDVEMETGTGKTYCYTKTIFELNKRFGWSKFIVIVPSIAIREGVYKSLDITAEHFLETYRKKARFFIYNSKHLHNLENFSSDAGINVMVINVQAFASKSKENRRIFEELDDFQSRRPIDIIAANRPILILDEPQKMEGAATLKSLGEFKPLFVLRYSATHKTQHNKVHRLDALDAYNKKLVKKISVRGISVRGLPGTNSYLYLESIETSRNTPIARMEIEVKQGDGINRTIRRLKQHDKLFELSGQLDEYKRFVVSDVDAVANTVEFTNGHKLQIGEATGDVDEMTFRRIQIRESIKAHLEKEQALFHQGIKVLTLFFIDEVKKYRVYSEAGETAGEYAAIFEEEYEALVNDQMQNMYLEPDYKKFLESMPSDKTHNGYFSIDKKSNRFIEPHTGMRSNETDDVDAYDLILKDKERLLSFEEPTRFIFSHSALREGWDNPNVFVICALKQSDNTISRRQEVGRGLRICVDQNGERQDDFETVHQINVLTVVANESYADFVNGLQRDISESLSARPKEANEEYFRGKTIIVDGQDIQISKEMARKIFAYLVRNEYVDDVHYHITEAYHEQKANNALKPLPEDLLPYAEEIFRLIDSVFSDHMLPEIANDRGLRPNTLNANFKRKEFKELWTRINQKAAYRVDFDSTELVNKCVQALNQNIHVSPLQYTVKRGEQSDDVSYDEIQSMTGFTLTESSTVTSSGSINSAVSYDLIGKIADHVALTRKTIASILSAIEPGAFNKFKLNPEMFIKEAGRLIHEQMATMIIEHLSYDPATETYSIDMFTYEQSRQKVEQSSQPLDRHIFDYVITESDNERNFVEELDKSSEVVVYAKLPKGFTIPTPVGNYSPDWAISFKKGKVKHIYFVAETKGSMSSMDIRPIEEVKISCARKFFDDLNRNIDVDKVKYDVVNNFGKLMEIVSDSDEFHAGNTLF